jgi:pyruvate kinase
MIRNTKIVATLGPASAAQIERLATAGVDVFRLNFSHGTQAQHGASIREIRAAAERIGKFVAILADLQGPKIRIRGFSGADEVELVPGAPFVIDTVLDERAGTAERVGTSHTTLPDEVAAGDVLVLGDGLIELQVLSVEGTKVACRVVAGGMLGSGKGLNRRGGGLSAAALTDKDHSDLAFACAEGVDYVAVSFPASEADMHAARALIASHGANCGLVAKLERAEAVTDPARLDAIILASDAVMVARGDLGVEVGDAPLMGLQKRIISRARELNRAVITATQMMESMISSPRPTRAEVMDVANAVVDGTDAVMLSAETAVGRYPVETSRPWCASSKARRRRPSTPTRPRTGSAATPSTSRWPWRP